MTDSPKPTPPPSDRAARLSEALRANLKRRKSQLRGRAAAAPLVQPSPAPAQGEDDGAAPR